MGQSRATACDGRTGNGMRYVEVGRLYDEHRYAEQVYDVRSFAERLCAERACYERMSASSS
jgi:hypothetical protein